MQNGFSKRGLTILIQGLASQGVPERERERADGAGRHVDAPLPRPEVAGSPLRLLRSALVRMHLA